MNEFIWTDLSTYQVKESIAFYSKLFHWEFDNYENYFVGGVNGQAEVGIYETPAFFQKIKMPHFWMNYIQVENLDDLVKEAPLLNAKVELKNEPFYGGKIALIRDPMGAGFTLYEGYELGQNNNNKQSIVARELHTSNAAANLEFYTKLFQWQINKISQQEYHINNSEGKEVGKILEIENSVKGKYEYWVTQFAARNYKDILPKIKQLNGEVILDEGHRMLVTDKFKEAFFYLS